MKRLFCILVLLLILTGCGDRTVTPSAELTSDETPLTHTSEVKPPVSFPEADGETVEIAVKFPDGLERKEVYTVYPDMFLWGDYLPVINYKTHSGEEVIAILDSNMTSVSNGVSLYKKAENHLPQSDKPTLELFYANSSANKFEEKVAYISDGERIKYKLTLPFRYHGVKDYYVSDREYDVCEIKQILTNGSFLLELSKFRKKVQSVGKTTVTKNSNSFYMYDSQSDEYICLADDCSFLSLSPDGKYYVYVPTAEENTAFYICGVRSDFQSRFELKGNDFAIVNWINKEQLYSNMGEEMPTQMRMPLPFPVDNEAENTQTTENTPTFYELDSSTTDAVCLKVDLHEDVSEGEFRLPKSHNAQVLDFGKYVPFFVGYEESYGQSLGSSFPVPMGAFINGETHTLEEGKALYQRVNDVYSTSDKILLDGKPVDADPSKADRITDVSSDFSRVLLSNYDTYTYIKDGEIEKTEKRWLYDEQKRLEEAPAYDTQYSASGIELYRDDGQVIFLDENKVLVYSRDTLKLVKSVDFAYTGNNRSAELWHNYTAYSRVEEVIDGRYIFVSYVRDVNHEGDCTCGTRGVFDNVLCRYDLVTDEYELITNHYQRYSVSPDGRYIAYTFNTAESDHDSTGWYELFEGCICIKELEGEGMLVLPYSERGYSEFSLPTCVWEATGWVEAQKLDEVLSRSQSHIDATDGVVVPLPDKNTVTRRLVFSEVALENTPVENEAVTFGDYLPMVRYGVLYDKDRGWFCDYSVLYDGIEFVDSGVELYDKLNEKYSELYPMPKDVTAENNNDFLAEKLFASRLVYISTDLKKAVTFALQDKGKIGESTDWTDRSWGGVYKAFTDGTAVGEKTAECVYDGLEDGERNEFDSLFDGKAYRLKMDGRLYSESYRDSEWIAFTVFGTNEDTIYVYSIDENRITYALVNSEHDWYSGMRICQIVDGRYLAIEQSGKGYLYDCEKDELQEIGRNCHSLCFSPDMKYVIYSSSSYTYNNPVEYRFYIKNLETKKLYSVKSSSFDVSSDVYFVTGMSGTVNWLSRENLEEILK